MSDQGMAALPGEACLFLRPGKSDITVESPEIASGYVVHLSLDLAKVSLRRLEEEQGSHEVPSLQEPINPTEADAIGVLVEKLGKLVASLKWLAALVALLVIVFALKSR
ncbi:hypothetical protein [Cupriavidus sp. YAF13]|uniref:hypothetical protein n=1 Tax=Cupriavidus sp. YAF13 TaxID=3233075 RepID=UPI003F92F916